MQNEIVEVIKLRWDKKFDEALSLFKSKLAPMGSEALRQQPRLVSAVCDCLRETGKTSEAVKWVVDWLKLEVDDLFENKLATNVGWLLFFHVQKNSQAVDPAILTYISKLIEKLFENENHILAERLFFAWAEIEKGRGGIGWTNIRQMISKLGYERFSKGTHKISILLKGKQKEVELASAYEQVLMLNIKALFASGQYEVCLDECQKALQTGLQLHFGNQIWITRYIALVYRQLGKIEEAIHYLDLVYNKRKEWFLLKELAELYALRMQKDKALKLALDAAAMGGYSAYKTSLFEQIGRLLEDSEKQRAEAWYSIAALSRVESGWRVSMFLRGFIPTGNANAKSLYTKLMETDLITPKNTEELYIGVGKLTRILHFGENGDGFITSDDGKTVYFRFSQSKVPANQLVEGMRLSFRATLDVHKGKTTYRAKKVYATKE